MLDLSEMSCPDLIKMSLRSSNHFLRLFQKGSIIAGNILDHYDMALYTLLAPFLAPLFFPSSDPFVQLMMAYGLLSTSILTRPIGHLFWGYRAFKNGGRRTLLELLMGVMITTGLIGFLPTYDQIGIMAPIALGMLRALQSFFAAAESTIASRYLFELNQGASVRWSSLFELSTIIGIALASLGMNGLTQWGRPTDHWRLMFWGAFLTGAIIWGIRYWIPAQPTTHQSTVQMRKSWITFRKEAQGQSRRSFLQLLGIGALSHLTYAIPFILMNGLIPLFTSISSDSLLKWNTILLGWDGILLLIFSSYPLPRPIMKISSLCLAIIAVPLFWWMGNHPTEVTILLGRWVIVTLGVVFAVPLRAWAFQLIPSPVGYPITSILSGLTSEILGRSSPVICLILFKYFGQMVGVGVYLSVVSLCAFWAVNGRWNGGDHDSKPA